MKVLIGKNLSFCFGVNRAINGIKDELKKYKKIKCLGELVHNEVVISSLEKKGVKFVNDIENVDKDEVLAIRAHGVPEYIYEIAQKKNINLIDYTCPKVMQIHKKIKEAENNGYLIILIGKKDHPETIGSKGYAKNIYVIEKIDEIQDLPKASKVFSIVQTTFSTYEYLKIEKKLKEKYNNIECINSICNSTNIREKECADIAKKVEYMIIIGGKNSSNTRKLYDVACANCKNCAIIQDEFDEKIKECKKYNIIGIMSGTSTPMEIIESVLYKIEKI